MAAQDRDESESVTTEHSGERHRRSRALLWSFWGAAILAVVAIVVVVLIAAGGDKSQMPAPRGNDSTSSAVTSTSATS